MSWHACMCISFTIKWLHAQCMYIMDIYNAVKPIKDMQPCTFRAGIYNCMAFTERLEVREVTL